ncbi:transient receptor potential cation channel subfamily V member 5-like isoform X2 [Babylonia areolata]|uniref:transient receptor potential cation channel subfamily V member 5-like isoform X2 n=1 Tax=Babylonia areolata TaxID=304850 RepID=UPI003FD19FD8
MGNRPSTVVASGVKAQGDVAAKELYTLVALGDGGELVTLTKQAMMTRNYTHLDQAMQTRVKPYLFNGGEGKKVPIADLVQIRNRDREKSIKISRDKQKKANELALLDMHIHEHGDFGDQRCQDRKYREQCWDVDQRGTVGETILHLCLLSATLIHYELAKRLIRFFPKLINDIYIGEEYYGETVLHLAIVNEDPAMVKFLLDHGADFNIRACGNFFCPEDQKESRTDRMESEMVVVNPKTNYDGYIYLGEYPLSFAACLGQEECVRLLLAKGADPNAQDSNGNTALHMLVIHNRKSMFDLLVTSGARLDIKNQQALTPLTLAAKLGRKDMYEHVLEKEREVFWIFGTVTCAGYPITDIDTISPTGEINQNSALNLIVYGEHESHLNMMDGLIVQLLQEKWKTFVRFRFYRRFVLFLLYFCTFVTAFALRPGRDLCAFRNDTSQLWGCTQTGPNRTVDPCYLLRPYTKDDVARLVMEVGVMVGAVFYLLLALKEIQHQGFRVFFSTLCASHAPAKALLLLSTVFVVLMLPGRAFCAHQYEDIMGVLAILCTAPYFLFFCRGVRTVGPFVVMIYKMIRGDLLRFVIIYSIFVIGFSQAFFIAFRGRSDVFSSWWDSPIGLISMSVGDFDDLYALFDELSSPFMQLTKVMFVVYMIMVTLLLVNMLIAMMGNTYELVTHTQKEWFRQWAKIVLMIELTVTPDKRTAEQTKYTQPAAGGKGRVFVLRWYQTAEEKEEMERLRAQNKIQQRTLARRKNALRNTRKLKAAAGLLSRSTGNPGCSRQDQT